ncbi:MAG: hypothetical protein H0V76_00855 [Blastocatellia bacterium]|nr:hypothetical protein [Blastocatellia bacterium]
MLGIFLLVVFVKVSIHYQNPLVLAVGYTLATFVLNLILVDDISMVIAAGFITMATMWLYFWLLERFFESSAWWLVMIGFPIGYFILMGLME